jgi:ferredoxin-NADP reductase
MLNSNGNIYKYTITNINHLNKYISEILLKSCNEDKLLFLPGQYIYVHMDNDKKLPYSIASAPQNDYLRLLINNGTDNNIINFFNKNHQTNITLSAPQGEAYYHNNDNHLLAISKGLSITPILSIISALAGSQSSPKVSKEIILLHVISSPEDLIFEPFVQKLQQQINIKYKTFITHGTYDLSPLFEDLVLMNSKLNNYDFYVFGSNLFVLDIYKELLPYCRNNFYSDINIAV